MKYLFWKSLFTLITLLFITTESFAFCISGNGACPQTGVGWPSSQVTFNTQIFGTVPANQQATATAFNSAFQQATTNWNNQSNFVYSAANSSADPCSATHTQGVSTQGWSFASTVCGTSFGGSTLAIARTFAMNFTPSINTIVDSDIVFNSAKVFDVHAGNQNGPTASCLPFFGQPTDFTRVAVHELGHALGLGHEPTNSAIMNPTASECIESPQTDDTNGLRALYGGAATVATVSVSLNATAFNTGSVLNLSATTVATTPATMADIYVALQLPNGSILAMQSDLVSFSATLSPLLSNTAVPGFNGQIFSYTFSGAEPAGSYKWLAALMLPGTLTPIGTIHQVSFTFTP